MLAKAIVSTAVSGRRRQRLKTEVLLQRLHQLPILRRCPLQAEPGVVMVGGCVFMAPQATGLQIDDLHDAVAGLGIFRRKSKSAPIIIGNWLMSISPSSETLPRKPIGLSVTLLNTFRKYGS